MDEQGVLAGSAFIVGILMGFVLAFIIMAWLGATQGDE